MLRSYSFCVSKGSLDVAKCASPVKNTFPDRGRVYSANEKWLTMGFFKVPTSGPLRSYVRTAAHGAEVAAWVTKSCNVELCFDEKEFGWRHDGESGVVAAALLEIGRRVLYQRIDFEKADPTVIGAIRNRVLRLRAGTPALSITTKPDVTKLHKTDESSPVTVWIVALPGNAYQFSEAAGEMHGLRDRFTVTVWLPMAGKNLFQDDKDRRAFSEKHGVASLSRPRKDGTVIMFGSAENIACAVEELGNTGVVVRKAAKK